MGIRTAWKALFEPQPINVQFSKYDTVKDLYGKELSNEELISELLKIRRFCDLREIQVIQQAARKLGWWG